jgi:glyoxylate reductase
LTRCWRTWTSSRSTARTRRRSTTCCRWRLRLLRPHAILVNTARGEIVDEEELIRLLETRAIAGAGLDVFEHEPAVDLRLSALDNVVLLPHMGSATIEGRIAMGERVIINIKTFADGHRPPDRVLGAML